MQFEQCRRVCRCRADAAFLETAAAAAALTPVRTSAAAPREHSASLPSTVSPGSAPHFVQGLKRKKAGEKVRKYQKYHFSFTGHSLFIW